MPHELLHFLPGLYPTADPSAGIGSSVAACWDRRTQGMAEPAADLYHTLRQLSALT